MINPAIFRKTLHDSAGLTAAAAVGIIGFVILFVWSMLNLGDEVLSFASRFSFLRKVFEAGFGIKVEGEVSINILFSVSFTHAVVLALSWAVMIAISTRVTVGEIEKGTADLLLTLPVSRSEVYFSTSLVWILAAILLAFCPVIGVWVGSLIFKTPEVVEVVRYFKPAANFLCLLLAVGGISSLVACCLDRRGPAIAIVVGIVLLSSVLNFIEPFIESLKPLRFFGLLNYFRPVDVFRANTWPLTSMSILLGLSFACWLLGLLIFHRREIPTA
jgi:ABC-2 type transport system permease protein